MTEQQATQIRQAIQQITYTRGTLADPRERVECTMAIDHLKKAISNVR